SHTVFLENRMQEARGNDHTARSGERRPHPGKGSSKKALGIAASVVDDDGDTAQRTNPDRGRGKHLPSPSGIGHHVNEFGARNLAPEPNNVRQEPEHGPNAAHATDPRRSVWRVDLNRCDSTALTCKQLR